ncbi:MAG: calcium-binding protein, partial [Caldilineaceae bacterium]
MQAAASPLPQPHGLSQQPQSLLNHAKTINRAWLQQVLHNAKPGAAIAVTSGEQEAQAAEADQSAVDRSVAITGTTPITNININILVNPDHIDEFLALLPSGDFSEADLINLLFTNIGSLPIDINFADLGQSGLDLANSTACDLIRQALQAQGLDAITVDLLAPIACAMISDGIDSAIGELEALLGGGTTSLPIPSDLGPLPIPSDLGPLVDSAVTEVSNAACDLVTQAINAQGLDALTASLLADVVCTIISDNISSLKDEVVAVANGGLDQAALLALATDLSSQVIDAVTNLLPNLDALGVLGGDPLSLVGDLIGIDIGVSFTIAAPGELDDGAVAQVIVTTNSGGGSEEPINSCGGFALVEDVNGELTAPDFDGTLIVGTNGPDELFGTPGDDLIVGLAGDDDIYGSHGNDVICGGPGVDVIDGENGDDALYGDAQADWLIGGNNNDLLYGGAGNDDLEGNNGEDLLYGEAGADVLLGGNGQDEV